VSSPAILVVCALLPELRYAQLPEGVEVLACGVGPVEAAIAVATELARTRYDAVLNAGLAGAYRTSANVGDAVLVVDETYAELGLEGGGPLALPEGARLAARVDADPALLRRCAASAPSLPRVRGLTVAQITATDATAQRLAERYATDVESMEGFSVLRAAALAKVPALEVRGISNYVGARDRSEWDFAAGARATARALESVLQSLVEEFP